MKKHLLLTLIISILFFSCGGQKSLEVTESEFTENLEYIEISIKYPQIKKYPELTQKITDYINKQCESYKTDSKEFWDDIHTYDDAYDYTSNCCYEETFEIAESKKYLSITTNEYVYLGGAHGGVIISTWTINKKTGEEISLENLTGMNYEQISKECRRQLIDTLITNNPYEDEDTEWLEEYIENGTEPQADFFKVYAVSENKVTVTFNQYQVAPYVYGIQSANLPLIE